MVGEKQNLLTLNEIIIKINILKIDVNKIFQITEFFKNAVK